MHHDLGTLNMQYKRKLNTRKPQRYYFFVIQKWAVSSPVRFLLSLSLFSLDSHNPHTYFSTSWQNGGELMNAMGHAVYLLNMSPGVGGKRVLELWE